MNASYEYDQDPRYGWLSVQMGEKKNGMIVVQDANGICHGFIYEDGAMKPTCICSAWSRSECACSNLDADYWRD